MFAFQKEKHTHIVYFFLGVFAQGKGNAIKLLCCSHYQCKPAAMWPLPPKWGFSPGLSNIMVSFLHFTFLMSLSSPFSRSNLQVSSVKGMRSGTTTKTLSKNFAFGEICQQQHFLPVPSVPVVPRASRLCTCLCLSPAWRAHRTAASCGVWSWRPLTGAAPGSGAAGCCTLGPCRHAACSCWGPRRWTPCPGSRWAGRGGCGESSGCWSVRWPSGWCDCPRRARSREWGRHSCGWRTLSGRSGGLAGCAADVPSLSPGHSPCSALSGAERQGENTISGNPPLAPGGHFLASEGCLSLISLFCGNVFLLLLPHQHSHAYHSPLNWRGSIGQEGKRASLDLPDTGLQASLMLNNWTSHQPRKAAGTTMLQARILRDVRPRHLPTNAELVGNPGFSESKVAPKLKKRLHHKLLWHKL